MAGERWLEGQHAIVTGASRGIGAVIASQLARRGATVTIMARSQDALAAQAARLRDEHGVEFNAVACDVGDEGSVADAFARAIDASGPAHILVNNAGVAKAKPAVETTRAMWDEAITVNLTGTFLCTMQVLPAMIAARHGRVVNVASVAGLRGFSTLSAYCASKHGIIGLTRSLAVETAKSGVTVNAVCPGYVETEIVEGALRNIMEASGGTMDEARKTLLRATPSGRFTTAEEVAGAVEWLCSSSASNVTGIALPLAGGGVQ